MIGNCEERWRGGQRRERKEGKRGRGNWPGGKEIRKERRNKGKAEREEKAEFDMERCRERRVGGE